MKNMRKLEGYKVIFKGDETAAERKGIITDIVPQVKAALIEVKDVNMVVLWDSDEYIKFENGQKIIVFDSGVSVYTLMDLPKFNVLTKTT